MEGEQPKQCASSEAHSSSPSQCHLRTHAGTFRRGAPKSLLNGAGTAGRPPSFSVTTMTLNTDEEQWQMIARRYRFDHRVHRARETVPRRSRALEDSGFDELDDGWWA